MRRKFGDRRSRPRFDIVGELWGTLETVLRLPVRNVSRGGALLESRIALPMRSVHSLAIHSGEQALSVPVVVSHVATESSPEGEVRYLIGIEFMATHPALLAFVDQWLATPGGEAAGA